MSFLSDASLVMIPSGYKDGTLYSAKPTNGDGDFTFSRGSNLAATRVNSDGLIEKGRENLLLQSNSFNTGWTLTSGSSVTGGQTGYDGSSDAWLLTDSGNSSAYALYRGYTDTGVQTFSIYAKQNTTSQIEFDFLGGGGGYLRVELTNGSLHATNNTIDYNIQDVGSGWYRCSFAVNHTSAPALVRIGCNGAGSIFIQDAQVEQGLVATDYIETGASTAQAGILEDMPRLDYSGGACPSLLLEPQRTNGITQSEYFDDWNKDNISLILNDSSSPEGLQNAHKITENTSTGRHGIYKVNTGLSSNVSTTFSFFVKQGTSGQYAQCSFNSNIADYWVAALIDLSNGNIVDTASSVNATYENSSVIDFNNGWYRITLTGKFVTTEYHTKILISNTDSPTRDSFGNINYTGDGARNIYAYGAMLEEGSYPTSYIPTYGASVTRSFDNAGARTDMQDFLGTDTGAWLMHLDEFYFDVTGTGLGAIILAENGQQATSIELIQDGQFQYKITLDNSTAIENLDGEDKLIMNWSGEFFKIFVNGVNVYNISSSQFSHPFTHLFLPQTTRAPHIKIKQMLFFPTALTDDECIELTTI